MMKIYVQFHDYICALSLYSNALFNQRYYS